MTAIKRTLWDVSFSEDLNCASVFGFDQFTAATFCLYVLLALIFLGMPFYSWMYLGFACIAVVAAVLISQGFRFNLVISEHGVSLRRKWICVPFRHTMTVSLGKTDFIVMGTNDWGEVGTWPIREFCEIRSHGRGEMLIGTPDTAVKICHFLLNQKERLLTNNQ